MDACGDDDWDGSREDHLRLCRDRTLAGRLGIYASSSESECRVTYLSL